MTSITQFVIDKTAKQLIVQRTNAKPLVFAMEFLRVIDDTSSTGKNATGKGNLVTNKKHVLLVNIESISKHGFRFLFDDGFNRIIDQGTLEHLSSNDESLWQHYLDEVKKSGLTREATIDIKAL